MNNRNYLILTIVLILTIAVGAWLLAGKKFLKPTAVSSPSPIAQIQEPRILSLEATKLKRDLVKTDKETGDLVLETNADFQIKYLIFNDQFIVTIKEEPFGQNKQQAQEWFLDKGFVAEDLCLLKITFAASREVKPDFSQEDALPTSCPTTPSP